MPAVPEDADETQAILHWYTHIAFWDLIAPISEGIYVTGTWELLYKKSWSDATLQAPKRSGSRIKQLKFKCQDFFQECARFSEMLCASAAFAGPGEHAQAPPSFSRELDSCDSKMPQAAGPPPARGDAALSSGSDSSDGGSEVEAEDENEEEDASEEGVGSVWRR